MPTIGFIGLGNMGRGMAANLQRKGESLVVHDVVEAPVRALVELGARRVASAEDVAAASDIVFTMLPTTAGVEEVLAGPDGALTIGGIGLNRFAVSLRSSIWPVALPGQFSTI